MWPAPRHRPLLHRLDLALSIHRQHTLPGLVAGRSGFLWEQFHRDHALAPAQSIHPPKVKLWR